MDEATRVQPIPTGDLNSVDIVDLVKKDLDNRAALGLVKYGQKLKVLNGRSHLVDLYQELCDAVQYCKGEILKREYLEAENIELKKQNAHITKQLNEFLNDNLRLREALKPFAEAFEPRTNMHDNDIVQKAFDRNCCTPTMTMGNFRKAAEAMDGNK